MRILLTSLLLFSAACSFSQDSLAYARLGGKQAPDISLYDTAGKKVKLSSFRGKVIYLDFWTTTCAPCIKLFPSEEKLSNRLQRMQLDTSIVIVKICSDCPPDEWKQIISKHHNTSVNLLLKGQNYSLKRKLHFVPFPTYYIIGKDFTFLGADVARSDHELIDYILFRAVENISFSEAIKEAENFSQESDPRGWYRECKYKFENARK